MKIISIIKCVFTLAKMSRFSIVYSLSDEKKIMKLKFLNVLSILGLIFFLLMTVTAYAGQPLEMMTHSSIHMDNYYKNLNGETAYTKIINDTLTAASEFASALASSAKTSALGIGDVKFLYADGWRDFTLRAIGHNAEIWVANDLSYCPGDSRPPHIITQEQIDYIFNEFNNNIYSSNTANFGFTYDRDGTSGLFALWGYDWYTTDNPQRLMVLLYNIIDENYCNPVDPHYVPGYFWATMNAVYADRNIIYIDSGDWENRIGPDAERPYFYEGVFAHQYEHAIHYDHDPDESVWVDEGLADLAGFLCGYGHPSEHVANYMVFHPWVSLTFPGEGGLEHSGASYLFQLYLFEKYGGVPFTSALVQEQANGIGGIENTLSAYGYCDSFNEIFNNWTIANYIDDTRKDNGRYGYETLQVGTIDTWGYSIEHAMSNFWFGPPFEAPFTLSMNLFFGEPPPYTAHYIRFNNESEVNVMIDGDNFAGTTAYSGTYEWYSDVNAWAWRSFYQSFDIPDGGATLKFFTYYEIEEDWDYGYVEVYDHDTGEWYTLDSPGTIDYVAHPQDNPNTLEGREPSDYEAAGRWYAFTGESGGWIPVSMDLTPFAGHTIDLYFTTWQDSSYTLQMMYVDDITIPEIGFFDDIEAGEGGWSTTGWYITDGIRPNSFSATVIDTKWVPKERYPEPIENSAMELHDVKIIQVDKNTQSGVLGIPGTPLDSERVQVVIVTNKASHSLSSNYELNVE